MRSHRLLTTLLAGGLVLGAVGCGSEGSDTVRGDGTTTSTTATTSPESTTTVVEGGDPVDLPADQVVWREDTGGGFVPPEVAANQVPTIVIYGDGRAFVAAPDEDGLRRPVTLRTGTVAPEDLEAFLAQVEASGLLTGDQGIDFGMPQVTDGPTTSVTFQSEGPQLAASAYFLSADFEAGLTEAQLDRRHALTELVEQARSLPQGLTDWTPDRVRVRELAPSAGTTDGEPSPWPGPAPEGFLDPSVGRGVGLACGELTGAGAAEVFTAAQDNRTNRWLVDANPRVLVVTPLVPGQQACP